MGKSNNCTYQCIVIFNINLHGVMGNPGFLVSSTLSIMWCQSKLDAHEMSDFDSVVSDILIILQVGEQRQRCQHLAWQG